MRGVSACACARTAAAGGGQTTATSLCTGQNKTAWMSRFLWSSLFAVHSPAFSSPLSHRRLAHDPSLDPQAQKPHALSRAQELYPHLNSPLLWRRPSGGLGHMRRARRRGQGGHRTHFSVSGAQEAVGPPAPPKRLGSGKVPSKAAHACDRSGSSGLSGSHKCKWDAPKGCCCRAFALRMA